MTAFNHSLLRDDSWAWAKFPFFCLVILTAMAPDAYTLEQVLAVARSHPFYERTITYPPDPATVAQAG